MEEKEIDSVNAPDVQAGDLIRQDGVLVTVVRVEDEGDFIYLFTDDDVDEPVQYPWNERVTLYGY